MCVCVCARRRTRKRGEGAGPGGRRPATVPVGRPIHGRPGSPGRPTGDGGSRAGADGGRPLPKGPAWMGAGGGRALSAPPSGWLDSQQLAVLLDSPSFAVAGEGRALSAPLSGLPGIPSGPLLGSPGGPHQPRPSPASAKGVLLDSPPFSRPSPASAGVKRGAASRNASWALEDSPSVQCPPRLPKRGRTLPAAADSRVAAPLLQRLVRGGKAAWALAGVDAGPALSALACAGPGRWPAALRGPGGL